MQQEEAKKARVPNGDREPDANHFSNLADQVQKDGRLTLSLAEASQVAVELRSRGATVTPRI